VRASSPAADTDEHRLLRDAVAGFAARATNLQRVRTLRGTEPGFDRSLWTAMAAQGWLGIVVPEAYGGQGLGFAEMRIVVETLGGALIPEPLTACAVLATRALVHGDNEALKRRLLPQMVEGSVIVSLAWQEDNAGTEWAPRLSSARALESGQGHVLKGRKRFVTPAAGADGYLVAASVSSRREDGHEDVLGLYYVPAGAQGLSVKLEKRADGTFSGLMTFKDVLVAPGDEAASPRVGAAALRRALDEAAIMASVELCAVMCKVLDLTLGYMKTRVRCGKPLGSFQALQHRAADLWIQKELASAIVDHAVQVMDGEGDPEPLAEAASRAKSRCSDASYDITRDCIRLHGAIGFGAEAAFPAKNRVGGIHFLPGLFRAQCRLRSCQPADQRSAGRRRLCGQWNQDLDFPRAGREPHVSARAHRPCGEASGRHQLFHPRTEHARRHHQALQQHLRRA